MSLKSALMDIAGMLAVGTLRLSHVVYPLRVGLVQHRSIGRLAGNIEYYFRKRHLGTEAPRGCDILIAGRAPVNSQIMKMIVRRAAQDSKVRVIACDWLWRMFERMQGEAPSQPGRQGQPPATPIWLNLRHAGFLVEWETWQKAPAQFAFTAEEEARGQALLRSLGIPEGAPFVTMHARDKAYTDSPDYIRRLDDPFAMNDFRDCDIETYLPAARWLNEQGIWVVRVGHQIEGPLREQDPMVVDFAGRVRRHLEDPDFADVYLQAKCKFMICCTAGQYYLSHIFNVPLACVNLAPLAECGRLDHDLFILKRYWNKKLDRYMTFPEMVARGADWNRLWHDKLRAYADEGIEFVDNTADEILDLVKEMNARLDGKWESRDGDPALQDMFRSIFPDGHPMCAFPGYMGAAYARQNKELLA